MILLLFSTCGLGFPCSHCHLFVLAFLFILTSLVTHIPGLLAIWAPPHPASRFLSFCSSSCFTTSITPAEPGVLREQGTPTSDRSRPGDIYHPPSRISALRISGRPSCLLRPLCPSYTDLYVKVIKSRPHGTILR